MNIRNGWKNDRVKMWVKGILAVFYPPQCPFCQELTGGSDIVCCQNCRDRLPFVEGPRCFKCGKTIASAETEFCRDCAGKAHVFRQGVSLWSYDKIVKGAVYRFKYKNRRAYASCFARELARKYGEQIRGWNAQAIIPVPIHRKRYRQRGYNQAELLSRCLSEHIQVPVCNDLVVRTRNTKPQKELNDKERQKNLKNAFKIVGNSVKLKRVIVVDDIYTTGATADAMAQVLQSAGIEVVYVVTLCIGKGY